jgi:biotin synthase
MLYSGENTLCYAIPGKLVAIKGNIGVVDYFGEHRNVLIDTDAKVGEYVYAQGGVLISKVSKEEAEETLALWKEQFFALKKVDQKLSSVKKTGKESANTLAILQKVNVGKQLSKEDMLALLKLDNAAELKLVYDTANNLRQKRNDNACCVHGILEFSNYCKNNCHYCGIRKSSRIKRYRMTPDEIIAAAEHAVKELGFKAIVLQSGEDEWYDDERLARIVREIRAMGVLVFISIGVRSKETYKRLYDAGARAVLLRFETSNRKTFDALRPGTNLDERLELIKYAKKLGYILATGFIVGLPGETDEDLIDNILLTRSLGADMYSFGPLIPAEETPLEKQKPTTKEMLLKTIALTRFADPEAKILVTTAFETLDKDARREGLLAGANSLMLNITPVQFRKLYRIYPGRPDTDKKIEEGIKQTVELLYSLGRAPTDLGI